MKVQVIEVFRDKYTDEVYELNRELEVDKKRFEEIKEYVQKANNDKTKKGE